MKSFSSAALRNLRKSRGLTQLQLGQSVGTTEQHVQQWEYGTRSPSATYLLRIMVVLDCTPVDLLMDDPASPAPA